MNCKVKNCTNEVLVKGWYCKKHVYKWAIEFNPNNPICAFCGKSMQNYVPDSGKFKGQIQKFNLLKLFRFDGAKTK